MRHLVDEQPAPGPEELHRHDADAAGDFGHLLPQGRRGVEDVGVDPTRHEHLAADPTHLRRLDGRPGRRRAGGTPGHHDGQLGLQRQQLLHHDLPGHAGQDAGRLGPVGHGPDALAVVATARRFDHDGPAVAGCEAFHGIDGAWPLVHHQVGGDGHAGLVEHGAHPGLVDRQLERRRPGPEHRAFGCEPGHQVEVDLLVVEGQDVAAGGEGPEILRHEGRAQHHLGGHAAGGIAGMFGQDGHGETERAGRLTGHAGQLTSADEPDRVRAQVARPRAGIRLDSGADTTGRLREEHQGHGQAAAHREHD